MVVMKRKFDPKPLVWFADGISVYSSSPIFPEKLERDPENEIPRFPKLWQL